MTDPQPLPEPASGTASDDQSAPSAATLRQAAAGDAEAWRRLVEAYTDRVWALLLRQCRDRELAMELTQATFVKVAEALGRRSRSTGAEGSDSADAGQAGYQERGRFEAWLFRIALNALRDEMRRRKRQASPVDMSPAALRGEAPSAWGAAQDAHHALVGRRDEPTDDPAEATSRRELVARLYEAVGELSEPEQRVLHLRHTAGLGFAEIAEALGQPVGTVLARHHRAVGKLRKRLGDTELRDFHGQVNR